MRKVIVGAMLSIDGAMQATCGPEDDPTGGFSSAAGALHWVMTRFSAREVVRRVRTDQPQADGSLSRARDGRSSPGRADPAGQAQSRGPKTFSPDRSIAGSEPVMSLPSLAILLDSSR